MLSVMYPASINLLFLGRLINLRRRGGVHSLRGWVSPPQPGMEIVALPWGFTRRTFKKFNSQELKTVKLQVRVG